MSDYAYQETGAKREPLPINSALGSSLEFLAKCESIATNIKSRIHGSPPLAGGEKANSAMPNHANWMANALQGRLETLANNLSDIEASF